MKDKSKTRGGAIKGMIKAGGNAVDKALDKGSDVATLMINNATRLISKLSDDVGMMADRILTMEERIGSMAERIGLMADRIVHTEELMAKLAATMADKELDVAVGRPSASRTIGQPLLSIATTEIPRDLIPALRITGESDAYLLYVSSSPLFRAGDTVVTYVCDADAFPGAWRRSIEAITEMREPGAKGTDEPVVVSVAVRTVPNPRNISPLSNSVDVTLHVSPP
jgi:hypothetical protein